MASARDGREEPEIDDDRREPEIEEAFDRLVSEGSNRLARPLVPLLATGFVGGIDVGVGVLAYLVVDHETGQPLLAAAAFPVGFIALLLARSELFTENFLVPVTARIAGRGSWFQLVRLWLVTLAANLAGGLVMAAMMVVAVPDLRTTAAEAGGHYASLGVSWRSLLLAVLGGMVITLLTRMQHASDDLGPKLVAGIAMSFVLVAAQLFHSVLDSILMFTGLLGGHAAYTWASWAQALGWSAAGNLIGGIGLVTSIRLLQVPHRVAEERAEQHSPLRHGQPQLTFALPISPAGRPGSPRGQRSRRGARSHPSGDRAGRQAMCLAESWTMDERAELLEAAVDITRAASSLAAQRFLEGVPVSKKADDSEVTPADIEVEELIRSLIAARFPGDGVAGEELADTPGTTGRRWVIDPIDGTSAFARRIPMFGVLLAVEDTDGSAVAVSSYPMSQDLIYAGRGLGCWHQVNDGPPQRLAVSSTRHPRGAWAEMVNPATWSQELLVTLHREVLLVPDVKGMLAVACGWIDALIIAGLPMGYEDIAPNPLIITEAGGRVSDLAGNDVLSGNGTVLASNGHIHDALLDLVRDVPTGRDYQSLMQARR